MVLTSEQAVDVDETHVVYSSTVNLHVEITFVVVVSQKTTKTLKMWNQKESWCVS